MSVQPIVQPIVQPVVIQQPGGGQQKIVTTREGHRSWSYDIMDCCNDQTSWVLNCICPCIAWYEIAVRLQESPAVPFCVPGGIINFRTRVRTLGGIQGNICSDCTTMTFCHCCALGQMERELITMGW